MPRTVLPSFVGALTAASTAAAADAALPASPGTIVTAALAAVAIGAIVWVSLARRGGGMHARVAELENELARLRKTESVLKEAHDALERRLRERNSDLQMSHERLDAAQDSLADAETRLSELARIDALTGLANRRQFDEVLETEIRRNIRVRKPVSLLITEIDCFDAFRDGHGDARGADALRRIATAIADTFRRAPDVVARVEDQQFGIIMPATDTRDALRFAERLRENVWETCIPHIESDVADRLTVSVGIATMQPDKLYRGEELLAAARRALVAAGEAGRNCVELAAMREAPGDREAALSR